MKETRKEERCDDCGCPTFEYDHLTGTRCCSNCGLIDLNFKDESTDEHSNLSVGENRQYEAVRNSRDLGTGGAKIKPGDMKGVKNPKQFRNARMKYDAFKESHPFARKVLELIEKEFGKDVAMIVAPIVEMACRPLTAEQEAERKAHPDNSIKKKLGMPKQRICRQKSGSKGTSEIENILIIAVAIVELAGELGILEKLDRRRIKSQFGLSPKQITKARKIILDHWKARYSMGWVNAIPRKSSGDSREDNISQTISHISDMLKDILPEDVAASILKDVQRRIEVLGEGKANAITTNSDAKMLVAALFYASVLQHGLERGLLNKIADAADHTGSGVSASLKRFKEVFKKAYPDYVEAFLHGDEDEL